MGFTINDYDEMKSLIKEQIENERNIVANLANIVAFIKMYVSDVTWVGFYITEDKKLILGPFQGKAVESSLNITPHGNPCIIAAYTKDNIIIPDVKDYTDFQYKDEDIVSAVIMPVIAKRNLYGVFNICSNVANRFKENEISILKDVISDVSEMFNKKFEIDNLISNFKSKNSKRL